MSPSSTDAPSALQDSKSGDASPQDRDAIQLKRLGYKQQLHRSWRFVESFAPSNFIGYIRSFIFLGLLAGGPAATWSSFLVTLVFMIIIAAVLAEICSALPVNGSIYVWAAESAGPKYTRFFGFLVAWWACTAWIAINASICQTAANYITSQLVVWEIDFPGGSDNNIKWRAFIFYPSVFKISVWLLTLDFFLCLASRWRLKNLRIPIGFICVHHDSQWHWISFWMELDPVLLCAIFIWISLNGSVDLFDSLFTVESLIGFDASGHIAEETRDASVVAAQGILFSAIATGTLSFVATFLFLFCMPNLETVFALNALEPFVQIYSLALGEKSNIFMTVLAVLGFIMSASVSIIASSRLIFAVARDSVPPLSGWVGRVDAEGKPRNATTVIFTSAAILLCTILPSDVAFTSLISAGSVLLIASYGLIALLRLCMTPNLFQSSHFRLGRSAKPFYVCAVAFSAFILAVDVSPFYFPVTAQNFNFALVIFVIISILAVLSWYFVPEDKWLRRDQVLRALEVID